MRKVVLAILAITLTAVAGEMFLVEYFDNEEYIVPVRQVDTAAEVTFSINRPAYVSVATAAVVMQSGTPDDTNTTGSVWMVADGDSLSSTTQYNSTGITPSLYYNQTLFLYMESGEHNIQIKVAAPTRNYYSTYKRVRLQALILLEDTLEAVTERPDASQAPTNQSSCLTSSNYVRIEGCNAIHDIMGRKMDLVIEDGRVIISDLPAGTYFAGTSTGTVKIVKMR
jgi:hypothetical protein